MFGGSVMGLTEPDVTSALIIMTACLVKQFIFYAVLNSISTM